MFENDVNSYGGQAVNTIFAQIVRFENHCLSFEQVSDEIIADYKIPQGDFDTITGCKYSVPGAQDIGRLYSIMIEDCAEEGKEVEELIQLFSSFISDEISRFQTDIYYQNPSYLEASYRAGSLLD